MWHLSDAVNLCKVLEEIAPEFGAHVALTGGTLYKEGLRKDCDVLFYRIRQVDSIDQEGLFKALSTVGLTVIKDHGWCVKCRYQEKPVDVFFPESHSQGGGYRE